MPTVGAIFTASDVPANEGVLFEYGNAGYRLFLFFEGITQEEATSVQTGKAEFGLLIPSPDILFFCYRFTGPVTVGWGDGPYNWHRQQLLAKPPAYSQGEVLALEITMVNIRNKVVCASRRVRLSHLFSERLMSAIATQANRLSVSREQNRANIQSVYARYPDTASMAQGFSATCVAQAHE